MTLLSTCGLQSDHLFLLHDQQPDNQTARLGEMISLLVLSLALDPNHNKHGKFDIQSGSNRHQMGQIWDFLRPVSVHFGAPRQNVLKLVLKRPDLSLLGPI